MEAFITTETVAFFERSPGALGLYAALAERVLTAFPDARARVQKTQITFDAARVFACASLTPVRRKAERPDPFLTVTFGLPAPLESPRALAVAVRPDRWTHHVLIGSAADVDAELMEWLREAHDFANRKHIK